MKGKRKGIVLCSLIALVLLQVGCRKEAEVRSGVSIDLAARDGEPYIVLESYGTTAIHTDTIRSNEGRYRYQSGWVRDSVDAILVSDSVGRLLLPLFPSGDYIRIHEGENGLEGEGVDHFSLLSRLYYTSEDSLAHPSASDLMYLKEAANTRAGYLYTMDRRQWVKDPRAIEVLDSLAMSAYNVQGDMNRIFGWRRTLPTAAMKGHYISVTFPIKTKNSDYMTASALAEGAKGVVLIFSPCPSDSTSKADYKLTLRQLDSLQLNTLTLFTLCPKPKGLDQKALKRKHYTLDDSQDRASEVVEQFRISKLPYYVVVDTLGRVTRNGNDPSAIIRELKTSIGNTNGREKD